MENNENSKLCIMIIPKTQKVKRIIITDWLPKVIFISIAIIFVVIFLFFNKKSSVNLGLEKDCNDTVNTVANLEEKIIELEKVNKKKSIKVDELKVRNEDLSKKMDEVEEKIKQIDKLKEQLVKMTK